MAEDPGEYTARWSAEDHASFEALCFHRADEVDAPYTALMGAPEIERREVAADIVKRAFEASRLAVARAYEEQTEYGAEIFVKAIARFGESPGRVPALISAWWFKHYDWFESNVMQERGGALNSYGTYYSRAFSAGFMWDSFWGFDDAFGEGSRLHFTIYHLTKEGLEYCLWRYPERVEQLRKAEEAKKQSRG